MTEQDKDLTTQSSTKNPVGRPLLFKTNEELAKVIDEYFDWCDNRTKSIYIKDLGDNMEISSPAPYTMSGLARRLGIDRDTLLNYGKRDEYFGTIKDARERVQEDVETRLMETSNQSGAIFNLKNNFGWKDKTETDLTSGGDKLPVLVQFIGQDEPKDNTDTN
jgi:hypothetical protein